MFKIATWDDYQGEPGQDLGVAVAEFDEAKKAAESSWAEYGEGTEAWYSPLSWHGPLGTGTFSVGFGSARETAYYLIHWAD